jgi:hypothetical protein
MTTVFLIPSRSESELDVIVCVGCLMYEWRQRRGGGGRAEADPRDRALL